MTLNVFILVKQEFGQTKDVKYCSLSNLITVQKAIFKNEKNNIFCKMQSKNERFDYPKTAKYVKPTDNDFL